MAIQYVNPFQVAIQGAGFKLTPLALAVQGFITYLEEQAQNVYGGGKAKAAPPAQQPAKAPEPVNTESEDALIQKVLEKWEAIEKARQVTQPEPDLLVHEKPVKDIPPKEGNTHNLTRPLGPKHAIDKPAVEPTPVPALRPSSLDAVEFEFQMQQRQKQRNLQALLTILAEV